MIKHATQGSLAHALAGPVVPALNLWPCRLTAVPLPRSLTAEPKIGDHWALWYRFELQFGTPDTQAAVTAQVRMHGCAL